jgi:uracil-DNA glycosylase
MTANLWGSVPVAWQGALLSCKQELEQIEHLLIQNKHAGSKVVPEVSKIFAALAMSPSDVSVVVIGQDPYPTPSHAIGLAFAVPNEAKPLPGSLRNIFKEVATDTGLESATGAALEKWVQQGVLLLNTSLTTNSGVRAAHSSWPWEPIVRAMIEHVVQMNPKVVGLLLGNHAKQFADYFDPDSIVFSAHPSPLSASRGFLGSKPFTRVNKILASHSRPEIIW